MKWEYLPSKTRLRRCISALLAAAILSSVMLLSLPAGTPAQPTAGTEDTTVKDVVTLTSEITDLDARLGSLSSRSSELSDEIESVSAEVEVNRERLAAKRHALSMRARTIYVNGRASNIEMLFSSDDFSDFMNRTDVLRKVTSQDTKMIDSARSVSERLSAALADLKSKKAEVEQNKKELSEKRSRLEEAREQREAVLARAGEQRAAVEQRSEAIESKMRELNTPAQAQEVTGRPTGRFLTMMATAYSPLEPGLSEATASGLRAQRGVVAVDPRVIPLGTRVHVEGYGNAIAGDTGSAIKGMRIDLCYDTLEEVEAYGWRVVRVEILD